MKRLGIKQTLICVLTGADRSVRQKIIQRYKTRYVSLLMIKIKIIKLLKLCLPYFYAIFKNVDLQASIVDKLENGFFKSYMSGLATEIDSNDATDFKHAGEVSIYIFFVSKIELLKICI